MSYETIRYEVKDSIATITLNRPEAYNALNLSLGRDLFHATLAADEDRAARCIVVTGAGKAFCAGGDVKVFHENAAKLLFHQSTQESLETQMELESQAIAASGHTEDFRDGVAAFARKQPAVFHGR